MKHIGMYRSYKLYEVSEQDLEITGANGSRYIRNSIIVFLPKVSHPKIGEEWYCGNTLDEVKAVIDGAEDLQRIPMQEQLKSAADRSKAQDQSAEQERQRTEEENERRRRERKQDEYARYGNN